MHMVARKLVCEYREAQEKKKRILWLGNNAAP